MIFSVLPEEDEEEETEIEEEQPEVECEHEEVEEPAEKIGFFKKLKNLFRKGRK